MEYIGDECAQDVLFPGQTMEVIDDRPLKQGFIGFVRLKVRSGKKGKKSKGKKNAD